MARYIEKNSQSKQVMTNPFRILTAVTAGFLVMNVSLIAQDALSLHLRDLNLPLGEPAEVLPGNAVLHLQLNQPFRTLERVESFLKTSFPEEILPPDQKGVLQHPHPLLLVLGLPLPPDQRAEDVISHMLGLNPTEPVSLTFYVGDPRKSFILCLPVDHIRQFEKGFLKAVHPKDIEEISVGGRTLVKVEVGHGPLSELYLIYGNGRVYISGQPFLIRHLHDTDSFPRLSEDPLFEQSLKMAAQDEIAMVLNPKVLRPLVPALNYLKFVPLQFLSKQREDILSQIPEPIKVALNQRMQIQFGIKDLNELADYAECILTATYEEVLEFGLNGMENFDGLSWSSSINQGVFTDTLTLFAKSYRSETSVDPIPVGSVMDFLGRYPGSRDHISIQGRKAPEQPAAVVVSWMDRLLSMLDDRQLKTGWLETLKKDYVEAPRVTKETELGAWTLNVRNKVRSAPSPSHYVNLTEYWFDLMKQSQQPFARKVTVIPDVTPEHLLDTWRNNAAAVEYSDQLGRKRAEDWTQQPGIVTGFSRVLSDKSSDGLWDVQLESGFTSTFGLLGFDQHEWVNRKSFQVRKVEDFLIYHRGGSEGDWLKNLALETSAKHSIPLPATIPVGTRRVEVHRFHNHLFEIIDWLSGIEKLMERETRTYLDTLVNQAGASPSMETLSATASEVEMPVFLYGVGREAETGDLYGLLPGRFIFPRPSVSGFLEETLRDFKDDETRQNGGLMSTTRVEDNMKQIQFTWNSAALSSLIRNVGNHLGKNYLSKGGPALIKERLLTEKDASESIREELVARNPRWVMLDQIPVFNKPGPKVDSHPGHPIPERSKECTGQQIDLSNHYNASLKDSWHKGGLVDNDLDNLSSGIRTVDGVHFDVRGIVQLTGQLAEQQLNVRFPELVREIPVNQKFRNFHLFHGTGWQADEGTQIAMIQLYYEDGTTASLPIIYGEHVMDWWTQNQDQKVEKSVVAWEGSNGASVGSGITLRLYKTTWENPHPEKEVQYFDYLSMNQASAPFMISATVD